MLRFVDDDVETSETSGVHFTSQAGGFGITKLSGDLFDGGALVNGIVSPCNVGNFRGPGEPNSILSRRNPRAVAVLGGRGITTLPINRPHEGRLSGIEIDHPLRDGRTVRERYGAVQHDIVGTPADQQDDNRDEKEPLQIHGSHFIGYGIDAVPPSHTSASS